MKEAQGPFELNALGEIDGLSHDAHLEQNQRMSDSNMTIRLSSAKSRQGGCSSNDASFPVCKPNHPIRKLSWLTLTMHDDGYRYIPQMGDEVVYLRQGHQEYIESTGSREKGPWSSINKHLRAVEICTVGSLEYASVPGSGDSCCKITLMFIDPSSVAFGKAFKLTLPELINFPDFIVEKMHYDAGIHRNWAPGEECMVWWRNENGEGGKWWEGKIVYSKPKSNYFPDSPWESHQISYGSDEMHLHNPWELRDLDTFSEHPHIDFEVRDKLLSCFTKLDRSVRGSQDYYGIRKLNEAASKLDFLNRFPVPLYPEIVQLRLENNYYRTVDAVKHDIHVMMQNARTYFARSAEISCKLNNLSQWFTRRLEDL